MRKALLINVVAGCLTLCMNVSAQGDELATYTTLDVPGTNNETYARGIDGMNIVGYYYSGGSHGFSYDGTTYTTLDVPGASHTYAYGIDGGNIVGRYYDAGYHGFSYDGSTYTPFDVPGASRTGASGIDGSNIVGSYNDGSGSNHGFLAVIPEPTTLSLLAVGMLMACRRRRRRPTDFTADLSGVVQTNHPR